MLDIFTCSTSHAWLDGYCHTCQTSRNIGGDTALFDQLEQHLLAKLESHGIPREQAKQQGMALADDFRAIEENRGRYCHNHRRYEGDLVARNTDYLIPITTNGICQSCGGQNHCGLFSIQCQSCGLVTVLPPNYEVVP